MRVPIPVQVVRYRDREHLVLRWRDPATRKWRTKSAETASRKDAQRAAIAKEKELAENAGGGDGRIPWEDFKSRYLAEHAATLADGSRMNIDAMFNAVAKMIGPKRLADITAQAISQFAVAIRAADRTEATVARQFRHLKAAMNWGKAQGLIAKLPAFPKVRGKDSQKMKSPPICLEQFERLLMATAGVVGEKNAKRWRFYLKALWATGLRRGESLALAWDDPDRPRIIDLDAPRPMMAIPGRFQKSKKDTLTPLVPQAAKLFGRVPAARRVGRVFRLGMTPQDVTRTVMAISKAAGVVLGKDRKGRDVYVGPHTLRRSFGTRWASRVVPIVLKQLMRHANIATTLTYYVEMDAKATADAVWATTRKGRGTKSGNNGRFHGSRQEKALPASSLHDSGCA